MQVQDFWSRPAASPRHRSPHRIPPRHRPAARAFLGEAFPRLAAWHDYLYRERDPENEGLVYIRHPWESGMDNSPMWDPILLRMRLGPQEIPEYRRVDTQAVAAEDRPEGAAYDRFAYLVKLFSERDYDEQRIREDCPFLVQDVLFNALLCQGSRIWRRSRGPWARTRGPVWININWLLMRGLERYGFETEAERLSNTIIELVGRASTSTSTP